MITIKDIDNVILAPTAETIARDNDYDDTIDRLEKSYAQAYAEGDRSSCEFLHNLIVELEW